MSQEYTPVEWVDDSTIINANRLDRMQTAHHYADGFREVDTVPTEDPEVDYHMVVYCTADSTFYRWNGEAWTKDVDDDTKALLLAHEADHANPHEVTKAQVGLGNVDNTSDADKPVSTAVQNALGLKADASDLSALETVVSGKYTKPAGGIPASDLSSAVQTSLGKADTALQAHQSIKTINSESMVGSGNISLQTPLTAGTDYVVPVSGKGLSANDYTDADKAKLAGIEAGAQVNVIESVKVNGTALTPSSKAVDVPVPTKTSDLTNDSDYTTASAVAGTYLSKTDASATYLSKTDAASTYATKSDITAVFKVKGSKATYSELPATGNVTGDVWNVLDTGSNYVWDGSAWDKLSETVDLSGYVPKTTTVNGHALSGNVTVTKADVGLGNCDNTSDANKPVSTATQTALNAKLDDSQLKTSWSPAVSDSNIPSEKLVKDTLDTKYAKPSGGIPASDLASGVQTSLGKADTAVQPGALATVATSGSYNDLSNKPTIPTVPVQDVTVNGTSVLDGTTAKVVVPAIPDLSLVTSGSGSFVTGLSVSGHQITQTLGTPAVATVDWSEIENKPTFATVATSGSYTDLTNKPTIPSTAADVGALPSTTLYAGSSTAGGAATSALKATADGNGNNIVNTYATKTEVSAKADDSDVVHKAGAETVTGAKTFSAKPTMSAGLDITGTLNVNGDINQNGSAYETHAQQVYTADDYIIMRDGAVAGLGAGDYAGFQVKKYDGINDGRLVIDKDGTARVGDVGDEEPLATRDESADMTDGDLVEWDAANFKMVSSGISADDVAKMHIVLTSQSVTFSLQSTPDYASWPYRADIANADTTVNTFATVVFDAAQATSGNYAPFCETANGHIYIYAKAAVGTVTIPTIHLSN